MMSGAAYLSCNLTRRCGANKHPLTFARCRYPRLRRAPTSDHYFSHRCRHNASYSRTPAYDSLSRPTQVTLAIGNKSYSYNRSYNSDSRLATLTYPSGFVAKYVYTTLGYLYQIQDNATSAVLWTAKSRDAELHLTEAQTGNGVDTIQIFYPQTGLVEQIRATNDGQDDGSVANMSYVFDALGNLSSRADTYASTEQFCYDALNRLTNYTVNGATCRSGFGVLKSVAYDDIGNITNKSDLADTNGGTGTYSYNLPQHPLPHAVMSISGTVNGSQNPGYRYDADGNLTCEYTGPNCSHGAITKETDAYWSFNMTHTISDGATSATLTYDSEHQRIIQALTFASTTTTTTYLNDAVSGGMEDRVASGGTTTWNDYLMADGRLIGERTCSATTPTCSAGMTTQYFITDHLGSVSVITDGTPGSSTFAQVTARESFDAWGKQRNPDWTDDNTCNDPLTDPTTRGFTGQEQIGALCLVNLNARLYDPNIGRFLSADSIVPDPYDGQSYNRYTYVDNRPLSLTDPTGHDEMGPDCIGTCGNFNPGSQADGTNSDAHPEMEVLGSFAISMSGNLEDGINAIHITYNVSGEQIANQDPTKNEVGMSGAKSGDQVSSASSSNPAATTQTISNLYANSTGVTQTETTTSDINPITGQITASVSDVGQRQYAFFDPGNMVLENPLSKYGFFGPEWGVVLSPLSFLSHHDLQQMKVPVYRVFDGDRAKQFRPSWTPHDPSKMHNWRDELAVYPSWNAGTYYEEGEVTLDDLFTGNVLPSNNPGSIAGPKPFSAQLGGGPYSGRGIEWIIPNSQETVKNITVFTMP